MVLDVAEHVAMHTQAYLPLLPSLRLHGGLSPLSPMLVLLMRMLARGG